MALEKSVDVDDGTPKYILDGKQVMSFQMFKILYNWIETDYEVFQKNESKIHLEKC